MYICTCILLFKFRFLCNSRILHVPEESEIYSEFGQHWIFINFTVGANWLIYHFFISLVNFLNITLCAQKGTCMEESTSKALD